MMVVVAMSLPITPSTPITLTEKFSLLSWIPSTIVGTVTFKLVTPAGIVTEPSELTVND